ncbi:hypothetical protein [Halobacillus sp. H74]|uniref:hypothetical protein n=1 Tax=Halobacillus sp. H74 TaxID=3457436 RepID=UPI003FCE63B3
MNNKDQINIYNYFGSGDDPIYQKVANLEKEDSVNLGKYKVFLNHLGIYEVSNEEEHVGFDSAERCYKFIQRKDSQEVFINI